MFVWQSIGWAGRDLRPVWLEVKNRERSFSEKWPVAKLQDPIILYYGNFFTVDPVYSEWVGAAKSVHYKRVFTINVFNLTIN
jgi:hypothetical protein